MQKKPHRIYQINEFIKQKFGEIIKKELEVPQDVLITITKVDTSKDLRHAKIGISIYPLEKTDKVFALLCKNLKHLKHIMRKFITFKFLPDIKLYIDKQAQKAFEIEELLDKIKRRGKSKNY